MSLKYGLWQLAFSPSEIDHGLNFLLVSIYIYIYIIVKYFFSFYVMQIEAYYAPLTNNM